MNTGLIKYSSTEDFKSDVAPIYIVNEQHDLIKRAAAPDIEKKKGGDSKYGKQTDLHVIALGSYEGYGCFFAETHVNTPTGIKNIEAVVIGDNVYSHTGAVRKVNHTFKKEYIGDVVALTVRSNPEDIFCTPNHPFYVIRKDEYQTKHRAPSLLKEGKQLPTTEDILEKASWVRADEIKEGDYVLTPHTPKYTLLDDEHFDDDDAFLMGYYLSEGCMAFETREDRNYTQRYVVYTLNLDGDIPLIAKLKEIFARKGWTFTMCKQESSENGCRIGLNNSEYARKLFKYFGHLASDKYIHPAIFKQNTQWLYKFIGAYLDGDGYIVKKHNCADKYVNTLSCNSSGLGLTYDLQRLFASLGHVTSISKGFNRHCNGCFGKKDHVIYSLSTGRFNAQKMVSAALRLKFDEAYPSKMQKAGKTFILGDYILSAVDDIDTYILDEKAYIYNLEVDVDNSYVVHNQAVHNSNRNLDSFSEEDCRKKHGTFLKAGGLPDGRGICRNHKNKKTDPRYGTIKQSSYNEKMRRVELLIGLDNDKCGNEIEKIASGGQVSFSMAGRMGFDVCSECGHKSYNGDEDRCDCIKNRLGDITKSGNIIHMKNPDPNWFELSLVNRPADRVAYSIKTASEHLLPKVAFIGDEIVDVPDKLKISKKASDKLPLVKKLAEIEKRVAAIGIKATKDKLDAAKADRATISKETIEELRGMEPSKVFKELANNGIVLKPEEFMQYLFADKAKEQDVEGMKSHLKDVYTEAEKKHGGELTNNDRFEPSGIGEMIQKTKNLFSSLKEQHSFFGEPSKRRVMSITMVMGFKPKEAAYREKTASSSDEALAKQYAAYKLAAVNYLEEQNKLEDGMLDVVALQNLL